MKMSAKYRIANCVVWAMGAPLLALVTLTPVAAQYQALIEADAPLVYLRLGDDGSFPEPEDIGDGSGVLGSFEKVAFGAPSLVPGESDTAAQFNAANRSLIRILDDPQINTGGPWEERTVEIWFNADNVSASNEQVIYEDGGATRGMAIYVRNDRLYMGAWNRADDDGGVSSPWVSDGIDPAQSVYFSTPIESGTTYHTALVMDGDPAGFTGTLTGYVDGRPFAQKTGVGQLFAHGDDVGIGGMDTNIWLDNGSNPGGDGLYFAGVIDEFALYDIALSDGQIAAHLGLGPIVSGDFNSDGNIDMGDFTILVNNLGTGTAFEQGDNNLDRVVDLHDFVEFKGLFSAGIGQAQAIPEPASGVLALMIAMASIVVIRHRKR